MSRDSQCKLIPTKACELADAHFDHALSLNVSLVRSVGFRWQIACRLRSR